MTAVTQKEQPKRKINFWARTRKKVFEDLISLLVDAAAGEMKVSVQNVLQHTIYIEEGSFS